MKYLKTYEEKQFAFNNELKIGDYILIDTKNILSSIDPSYYDTIDKLPDENVSYAKITDINTEFDEYKCLLINGNFFDVMPHEIIRYLTDEEIFIFKTKQNAIKYNL